MSSGPVVALSGGIGGAKLALGLYRALAPEDLTVVANPGDDFEHLGLTVCPDLDTVAYTLAGLANPETGWGRKGETWNFMAALKALGGEDWFNLGDGDLALHVERTRRLAAGEGLGAITADLCRRLGVDCRILPASDEPVRTVVETASGPLAFQHYFVRDRAEPEVTGFRFQGAEAARSLPEALAALADPELTAIVICPSNPFISIDPMLAIPGFAEALRGAPAPVVAVAPIVGGQAIKGPTAKMLAELGREVSAAAVARHYGDLIDGFVLDRTDEAEASSILGPEVHIADTVMTDDDAKARLAAEVLAFAGGLSKAPAKR
ncbi:MAG: 2-phospho-L-lactate transferase [Thiotrichales bacterium]|nr:2-phospho-L-lactate transferase [Thiotrichales bacterium]